MCFPLAGHDNALFKFNMLALDNVGLANAHLLGAHGVLHRVRWGGHNSEQQVQRLSPYLVAWGSHMGLSRHVHDIPIQQLPVGH